MLKSIILNKHVHRRCLSYFSNAFNNLANQGPSKVQEHIQNINVNNLNLDVFVNKDRKQMDLLDKLVMLRKQKECSTVPLLPNVLVQQLLEHANPQETITVLRNPLQYGLFIDQFTGCHLVDFLLNHNHAREAAQVSAILLERELCNNELVAAFLYKAFYASLKNYEVKTEKKTEESAEVIKVRVKFVRNYNEKIKLKTEEDILGEAIIKLAANSGSLTEIAQNISLFGFVLCGRITDAEKYLTDNQKLLYKEVLQACRQLMDNDFFKNDKSTEFINLLDQALLKCTQTNPFDVILDECVKRSVADLESQLIAEYTESFQKWITQFQNAVDQQYKKQEVQNRVENIENTLSTLESKRQHLWYFENKEDIDMQIFKKKVSYPKRWFGKKKKPKTVDAFYVPPTISRAH